VTAGKQTHLQIGPCHLEVTFPPIVAVLPCMKRGNADSEQEEEALAQKQQEAQDARYEVALRLIWVTLGIACPFWVPCCSGSCCNESVAVR
jgi:hypothetical protein